MGELLIKPYEISVWEDKLTQDGFTEHKIAVIGSNTMTGPNKVYNPIFNKKANGEKTLSFSLKYKYFDPYSGNEEVVNPFAALLVNERKVKLKYDGKWYEFIVKDHTEASEEYTWTYTCTDAFVLELSKNGYNLEFSADLNNNQGTAFELAEKTLTDTDWKLGGVDPFKQLVEEPIYKATLTSTTGIEIINATGNSDAIPAAGSSIYLFYSYVKNKNGKYVQFIIRDENRQYTIDDKNVITDTNFRIITELTYEDDGFYLNDNRIITFGEVEKRYQANRLAYNQLTTYDPVMQRTVDQFKMGDRDIYRYTDYTYTTSNVVMNFMANGDNFNALEDGTLQGWNPYVDSSDPEAIERLELITKPELAEGKELADLTLLSQIEGFLKVSFVGSLTNDYKNAIFNDGFQGNTSFINSISQGDEFVFRWRAGKGDIDALEPVQTLGLLVAKYTRDTPQRWGRYYYHIDPSDIVLQIAGAPTEYNNIVEGGHIETVTEGGVETQNYVIDDVAQNLSTKYLYKDGDELYYWDGKTSQFKIKDENYLPYFYLTGKARKSLSNAVLTDPTQNYGIFIYTTEVPTETYIEDDTQEEITENLPIYIQDIQFTRCVRDGDDKPILLGNVPTAISKSTEYYYLKPSDSTAAEDVETYTSIEDLQEALDTSEAVVPVYNEGSEKYLSISISQSNCFNVLQTIAETFECWIDLIVDHDDTGAIIVDENGPHKYVYLKEYAGKDNWAGFKYGINIDSIERNINSDEIVTKLIVDQSQSEYVDEGYVSIANAPSNPSGESYILNFDYYYNQGLLDRDEVDEDRTNFVEAVKAINQQIQDKEKVRRDLEAALTSLGSKRNVFSELVDAAQDAQTQALEDFEYLTNQTYEDYKEWYNAQLNAPEPSEEETEDDRTSLFEEETVIDTLGQLYASSATINNYSGILSNIEQEYWNVRKQLRGSENYKVKVYSLVDANEANHVIIDLSDFLPGLQFKLGESVVEESTISKRYFDITTDETILTFTSIPDGYELDPARESYTITESPQTIKIVSTTEAAGIEDEIDDLLEEKQELVKSFNNKYSRFIQEGTWNSTDYIDSELYYLDALQVSNTSAQPAISYTINVVEISQLEGYEPYLFDAGDKTYIEDTEFFGWASVNGILTPAREEVIVSEVEWHLDEPDQNVITIQNYKTRFEDFFQRVNAAVQTVQYNEATYAKISSLMDANGTINQNVLLQSLNQLAGQKYNLTSDGSITIDGDRIQVHNLNNTQNFVIINSEGIRISSDGGASWTTAIDGRGINIGTVYTGMLNTDQVVIGSDSNPSFRWDKSGISAYKSDGQGGDETIYDLKTYVRYDEYGLYGIKNDGSFKAQSLDDVKDKAHFAVTWDGFFIKNSYEGGGQVSITSDNDFQVLQSGGSEKIKIGALEWLDGNGQITTNPNEGVGAPTLYGIRIKNNAGDTVLRTGDDGNLEITGKITANSGHIGGMEVDNQRLKMKYIIFEPNKGIYSTYPNELGKTPVDPSVSVPPFIISDTDGSATFNNVTVRGSIKTSVFEYEEIQAVGGAFLFRPSSAIRQATVNGTDLDLVVEKGGLFKVGDWLKVSNFSSETTEDGVSPDELNGFGLTYIYPVKAANGTRLTLDGAAALLVEQGLSTEDLVGGSVIDFGRHATKQVEVDGETFVIDVPGSNNYGIGINSSDGFINLPPRAISLFETVIHPNQDPKVSYRFRGILGTLPDPLESNIDVRSSIYPYMQGKQGIYTDNMYIGDKDQYIAFYEDSNGDKHLKISAKEMVFEYDPDTGEEITWQDKIEDATQGLDGEDAITVRIDSSAGDIFLNKNIQTTLTCTVIKGNGTDITNQVTRFTWTKQNADGTVDSSWSRPLAGRSITLTDADVNSKAIFTCEVEF